MASRTWGNVTTDDVPEEISGRQFFQQLAIMEMISQEKKAA
ncbi:hypothetical protein ACC817_28650 [Rhizobium ruizarguesonis]